MALRVLSIGISEYKKLKRTLYADKDAEAFHDTMKGDNTFDGYQPITNHLILNSEATVTSINDDFDDVVSSLKESDSFYFYFAGHGCNYNGKSYISGFESNKDKIESTWICVEDLFAKASERTKKFIFFIDACQTILDDHSRQIFKDLSVNDKLRYLDKMCYQIVLWSCSSGQSAKGNDKFKHGAWTYFLLEALRGNLDDRDRSKEYILTGSKLQEHLHFACENHYAGVGEKYKQSAIIKGEQQFDFAIRSFSQTREIIYSSLPEKIVPEIEFDTTYSPKIKNLSGFKKGNSVPTYYSASTQGFVHKIAQNDLSTYIDDVARKLISKFGLKASEESLELGGYKLRPPEHDGYTSFECKYLKYEITAELDDEDLAYAIMTFVLTPYDQNKIFQVRDSLDQCFPYWFDRLRYSFPNGRKLELKDLFDRLEKANKDELDFEFSISPQKDQIALTYKADHREFTIFQDKVTIKFLAKETLDEMFTQLKEISNKIYLLDESKKLLE